MSRWIARAIVFFVFLVGIPAMFAEQPASAKSAPATLGTPQKRIFHFTYAFTVENPNPGKTLRVWFPIPASDQYQDVRLVTVSGDLPVKKTREKEYGNAMYYAETASADKPEYHFQAIYRIARYERPGLLDARYGRQPWVTSAELRSFLQPKRLVPVTGAPAEVAAQATAGKRLELDKARAIYEYVFENMKYDKTGTGWGNGDAVWACNSKHGNCTDFHSLFAAMAGSQGIPTRFEIGFPLSADSHAAQITGYHCWADFYLDSTIGHGWIPVDISEAWKHPGKKDYFFGTLDVNRVQLSTGRDLTLSPRQDGPAVNYFVYPYVESDGKEFLDVENSIWFTDLGVEARQVRNDQPSPNQSAQNTLK